MSWAVLAVSAALALAYGLIWRDAAPSLARTLSKSGAILMLAIGVWLAGGPGLVVAALVASAIGDAALAQEGEEPFRGGIVAFGVAQVLYIAAMGGHWFTAMALAGMAGGAASPFRKPPVPRETLIVIAAYAILLIYMAGTTLSRGPVLASGGALFVLSDALIGLGLLRPDLAPRLRSGVIWATYWAAQVCLAFGLSAG